MLRLRNSQAGALPSRVSLVHRPVRRPIQVRAWGESPLEVLSWEFE